MKNNKITAVYARTSLKKQNYDLQLEAAKTYLEGIEPESVHIFIDAGDYFAVKATLFRF